MPDTELANVLADLADYIERSPVHLVGARVHVSSGGGGSVTGLRIEAQGGAPGTRTVGMHVRVSSADYGGRAAQLVADIREAAEAAKNGKPAKSWVASLIDRALALGNQAIETGVVAASVKNGEYYAS